MAYNELVTLIEMKAEFRECIGCGKFYRFNPEIYHRNRRYCEDACYERTRKSEARGKETQFSIANGVQQPRSGAVFL